MSQPVPDTQSTAQDPAPRVVTLYDEQDPRGKILSSLREIKRTLSDFSSGPLKDELTSIDTTDPTFFIKIETIFENIRELAGGLIERSPIATRAKLRPACQKAAQDIKRKWSVPEWIHTAEKHLRWYIRYVFEDQHDGEFAAGREFLSKLDPPTFIFLSLVYCGTGNQDVRRELRGGTNPDLWYAVKIAREYLAVVNLPPDWIFNKGFQMAIASYAHLASFKKFRMAYHKLELELELESDVVTIKKEAINNNSPNNTPKRERHDDEEDPSSASSPPSKRPQLHHITIYGKGYHPAWL